MNTSRTDSQHDVSVRQLPEYACILIRGDIHYNMREHTEPLLFPRAFHGCDFFGNLLLDIAVIIVVIGRYLFFIFLCLDRRVWPQLSGELQYSLLRKRGVYQINLLTDSKTS